MKKVAISIVGLILIICLSFSVLGVNALKSSEWNWSSSGMSQSYYQGDSSSVTLTFYSSCPDQLKIIQVNIQFDWDTNPEGYTLANPIGIATNGQNTFSAISFTVSFYRASVGSHSYTTTFKGQQDGVFGWYDITATGSGSVTVHDAYEKIYNQNIQSVNNAITNAVNSNYLSPDAQALLQQAQSMYNQATSLANQGQWQSAVEDLNFAIGDVTQAAAKEATYVTPTPVLTPVPSNVINYTLDSPTPTVTVPEFPAIAVLSIFLALSLFAVTMLTIRKRKVSKS